MKVELTGNPFVDTGLATLATLADCRNIEELTLEKMQKVHGDGTRLARWSTQLKNVSMIFTTNYLAVPAKEKNIEKKVLYYSAITSALLSSIGKESVPERCESCGNSKSLDLDILLRNVLVPLGDKSSTKRYIGRNWFPLAGSLGGDAQSLPAGSRAPNICAKCLFSVHYLPMGTFLVDSKLVVFQSTSRTFWYGLAKSAIEDIYERVSAGGIDTLGSGQGGLVAVRTLLRYFDDMVDDLEPGISLFMWRFSNSGQEAIPYLHIEEIPNPALVFLRSCVYAGLRNEINDLMAREKGGDSLLQCISQGRDYNHLYPYRKFDGVSPKLFQLYQVHVRKVSAARLKIASAIAEHAKTQLSGKDLEKLGKDIKKDLAKQNLLKKYIVDMVAAGKLTYSDYLTLFSKPETATSIDYDAWKFSQYYLHNVPEFLEDDISAAVLQDNLASHVGAAIFTSIVQQKGMEKFRQTVLERLAHGKIWMPWLRSQFTKNATMHPGFTYAVWKKLCVNESGKEMPKELLFRLRLMWTEWIAMGSVMQASTFVQHDTDSGLPVEYETLLAVIMDAFVEKKGSKKFKLFVLDELQNGEKGLGWFGSRLSSTNMQQQALEQFFTDDNGNSIRYLRLFQMHLFLANRYREQTFKQHEVIVSR